MRGWKVGLSLAAVLFASAAWGLTEEFNKPSGEEKKPSNKDFTATVATRVENPQVVGLDVLGDNLQATVVVESNAPKKGDLPVTAFVELSCDPAINVNPAGQCLADTSVQICAGPAGDLVDPAALGIEFCLFGLAEADIEAALGVAVALDGDTVVGLGVEDFASNAGDFYSALRGQLTPE